MSEDNKRDSGNDHVRIYRRICFVILAATILIVISFTWKSVFLRFRSYDEQLAAIETSGAIPESENAGAAYIKLIEEYMPLSPYPRVVDNKTLALTACEPWLGEDYPKLAAWIDERKDLIPKLLDISRLEKCRLPIPLNNRQTSDFTSPTRHMHGWTFLLVRSANRDLGEGRIDVAIEKYACIMKMATHKCQQPTLGYYYSGVLVHYNYVDLLKQLIIQRALTDEQLKAIEAAVLPKEEDWNTHLRLMLRVQSLIDRRGRPKITDWRRFWDYRKRTKKANADALKRTTTKYHLRVLGDKREMQILIVLRRFKNKTGHWPQSLDLIEPQLSKETLIDPCTNKPFVYELKGENFKLHSKGTD